MLDSPVEPQNDGRAGSKFFDFMLEGKQVPCHHHFLSKGAVLMDEMQAYLAGRIAGVDEVGRGPLAGPVVAAAVILNPATKITGLADSKLLSESKREMFYELISKSCIAFAIGRAEPEEIDDINILNASLLAMQRAIQGLKVMPDKVLVDGNRCPEIDIPAEAIIQGDRKIKSISAASIMAKVTRDREMVILDKQYPGYGFAKHKGYGTKQHYEALRLLGNTPIHRRSFRLKREA